MQTLSGRFVQMSSCVRKGQIRRCQANLAAPRSAVQRTRARNERAPGNEKQRYRGGGGYAKFTTPFT